MTEHANEETRPDADLRDHLHQMEARVRKLRDSRNNHNEQAKRFAEQRNAIQAQYKEHRSKLDLSVAEVKAIRAEQNIHKKRRDAIQAQIRDLIGQAKSQRGDKNQKKFGLTMGQVINEKENKNMPSTSSLDEKLSDVVGNMSFNPSKKVSLNYNFAIDQNYNDLNFNENSTDLNFNPLKFNLSYLQEKKHIGDQEYMKAKINLVENSFGLFSAETKRNLVTNSAEYYDLSYEYLNDCLRAGIVYRREFYEDSELEAENSLMFKITIVPFGSRCMSSLRLSCNLH